MVSVGEKGCAGSLDRETDGEVERDTGLSESCEASLEDWFSLGVGAFLGLLQPA